MNYVCVENIPAKIFSHPSEMSTTFMSPWEAVRMLSNRRHAVVGGRMNVVWALARKSSDTTVLLTIADDGNLSKVEQGECVVVIHTDLPPKDTEYTKEEIKAASFECTLLTVDLVLPF